MNSAAISKMLDKLKDDADTAERLLHHAPNEQIDARLTDFIEAKQKYINFLKSMIDE